MPNRLARETSPYLLQHAHNPVDWRPWGKKALRLAREGDLPILLSIGYSACHWCHVMERESFEDPETARLMNRLFVNVKVDREERPDIDSIYMKAVQAMTGQGGWPLTAFLTPEGIPFHGGTYFPPEPRHGMPSFRQLLGAVADAYANRRSDVERAGAKIREVLRRSATEPQPGLGAGDGGLGGERLIGHAVALAGRGFDPAHGGFGGAPKFPQPVFLDFLLRAGQAAGEGSGAGGGPVRGRDSHAATMAAHTLKRMAAGGIRDHVGGGFHRYSVDARWLVPHFEKMLYDNALLARALTRASLLEGAPDGGGRTGAGGLGRVAEETLDYVLEDLASPDGAFFSARDADSEGEEGAFYLWRPGQVEEALDARAARLLCRVHDVSEGGNFEGRNILHLPHDVDAVARQEGLGRGELEAILRDARATLGAVRARRPQPMRDEKILASWNGMTIRALAEAGPALGRPDYTQAAKRAAGFLLETLRTGDTLHRVLTGDRVHIEGFLEDYAALGNALLSLYEATLEPRWLAEASWMAEAAVDHFWSPAERIFHDAADVGEELVVRPRDILDNATPSGNSLAVELLVRLAALAGREEWGEIADAVLARESGTMERYPTGAGRLLVAALLRSTLPLEITIVETPNRAAAMLARAHRRPHPHRVIAGGDPNEPLIAALPAMEGRRGARGKAFVCRGGRCLEPATTAEGLGRALRELAGS